jgi:LmbE family N-acetylglucosaminyl deacetylase
MTQTMALNNPYQAFVDGFARLLTEGAALSPAGFIPPARPPVAAGAPTALIFAPHPDDEVIIGGLPLRLLRELKINVVNVAVTLGSRLERRAERWQELKHACDYIGFGLVTPSEKGLEGINLAARKQDPKQWATSVEAIAGILTTHRPSIVFALHVGEVARNPYHLRLPAWMIDNVRRGAELVGGQGGAAPRVTFATLYRLRRWAHGRLEGVLERGRVLSSQDDLSALFLTPMES